MAKLIAGSNPFCDRSAYLFTSESVTIGHPDKVADFISDSVLDAMLAQDTSSRVACETLVSTGMAVIAGEVTTKAVVDIQAVVREAIKKTGYTDPELGFSADDCAVIVSLKQQSPDISAGVTEGQGLYKEQGAGDQGLMFGCACNETPSSMPTPIYIAHAITSRLARLRQSGKIPWLRPDGKSQVTVEYCGLKPVRIHTVVVSTQHSEDVKYSQIKKEVIEKVIMPMLPKKLADEDIIFRINPTGRFVTGGPKGDCGLTGRKIIVDTYGGRGSHGGGAFSGKDPTKVDRSASYMARYIAKNIVAAGLADSCEIQLAYAIGIAKPASVLVNTEGTAKVSELKLSEAVQELFPLDPKGIIEHLKLARPIYAQTAYGGHFGRDLPEFTWEHLDMVDKLRERFK